MKVLFFVVILVFSVLGLCEFLHFLKCILIFPNRQMCSTLVVMLREETANSGIVKVNGKSQVTFAGEQYKWLGNKLADRVLVVAENLNSDTLSECENLSAKYNLKFVVKGKI